MLSHITNRRASPPPSHRALTSTPSSLLPSTSQPPPNTTTMSPRTSLLLTPLLAPLQLWKRSRILRPILLGLLILLLIYKIRNPSTDSIPGGGQPNKPLRVTRYLPDTLRNRRPPPGSGHDPPVPARVAPKLRDPAAPAVPPPPPPPPGNPPAPLLRGPLGGLHPPPSHDTPADAPPAPPSTPIELQDHTYLPNGLLEVNPWGRHPIYDLIERGERLWREKLEGQSRTLQAAVREYRRRYGRKPPRGFDRWWSYVQRHNVQLPDEYDQILADLSMFYAYTPRALRRLQAATRAHQGTYTLSSSTTTGRVTLTATNLQSGGEEEVGLIRAREQLELLRGYGEEWTDEFGTVTTVEKELVRASGDWEATFSAHDVPAEFADWDLYEERRIKARSGQFMDIFKKPEMVYTGWGGACPHTSPLRATHPPLPPLPLPIPSPKTFIFDHRASMNPCVHPQLVHIVGFLSGHFERGPGPGEIQRVLFGMCKTEGLHGDVLTVASENWTEDVGEDVEWGEKSDERLVWRGSTTGILHSPETPWRHSQRIRLISTLSNSTGTHAVLLPVPPSLPVGVPEERRAAWLNTVLTDVAFTRAPIQCREGVCEEMEGMFEWRGLVSPAVQNRYKYMLDIDGNGWSARFKRLMTTNSLILKATIFPEWYMDRIMPWVHYVPLQMDLSDLYDVLSFFRGDVERGGEGGHDALAEKIASAGKVWSKTFFRREDMVAYMWRLFLEYGRLVNDDRESMEYDLP